MSDKARSRHTVKMETIEKWLVYLHERHNPREEAVVIIWREFVRRWSRYAGVVDPLLYKVDDDVGAHFRKHRQLFFRALTGAGITVVAVSAVIEDRLKHGDAPAQGEERPDSWYLECLPGSNARAMGFVCFPRRYQRDHPLIVASTTKRESAGARMFANGRQETQRREDNEVIAKRTARRIRSAADTVVKDAMADRYPLFAPLEKKQIEGS